MTSRSSALGDAALLIDWENLKYSLLNKQRSVSISALRDAAEKHGRLVVARAYADWQEHGHDAPNLYSSGIEPIYVPVRKSYDDAQSRTKNSVDVKLTADCIELIHRFPNIVTYILVSGDQDFIHVINTLRPYGKRTILIGVQGTTSVRLAEQVDEMIYYDSDVDPLPEIPEAAASAPVNHGDPLLAVARQSLAAIGHAEPPEYETRDVLTLVRAVVDTTEELRRGGRALLLSQLGIELGKRCSREFTAYGRGRLKPILSTMAAHKLIQLVQRGGVDWVFRADEVVPEEIESSTAQPDPVERGPGQAQAIEAFDGLSDEEKTALVRLITDLEGAHQFLSFNLLRNALQSSPLGKSIDSTHLLNDLISQGVLVEADRKQWFDSSTGQSGTYATFRLARSHADVRSRLLALPGD